MQNMDFVSNFLAPLMNICDFLYCELKVMLKVC